MGSFGSLAAASPAYAHNTVYAVLLQRYKGSKGGRIIALDAADGRVRWSRKLPSRAESSPLIDHGRVYFGSEDGTVYSLSARDGSISWRFKASGAVKAALAIKGMMLEEYRLPLVKMHPKNREILQRMLGTCGILKEQ